MLRLAKISLARASQLAARPANFAVQRPAVRAFSAVGPLRAADPFKIPDLSEEQVQEIMQNPIVAKLAQSPRTMEELKKTTTLMASKGFSGELGMMQQVKLMMDSEVREQLLSLKKLMDEEGIQLKSEDMSGLFKAMGINNGGDK